MFTNPKRFNKVCPWKAFSSDVPGEDFQRWQKEMDRADWLEKRMFWLQFACWIMAAVIAYLLWLLYALR